MTSIEELQSEIDQIKQRNKRVEVDKAWETSGTRKIVILVLTYVVVSIVFIVTKLPNPFINAVIPTLGFMLSTLSIPVVKKFWIKHVRRHD